MHQDKQQPPGFLEFRGAIHCRTGMIGGLPARKCTTDTYIQIL